MVRPPRVLWLLGVLLLSTVALRAGDRVFFAGFAFAGESQFNEENFPIFAAWDSTGMASNKALRERNNGFRNPRFEIVTGFQQADMEAGESVCLACVLDQEIAVTEEFEGAGGKNYKNTLELGAEALFFDFKRMSVVGSYPFTLQYKWVTQTAPGREDFSAMAGRLVAGDVQGLNFCDAFVERVNAASFNRAASQTLQVAEVKIEPVALACAPASLREHPRNFQLYVAQLLGRVVSDRMKVPVLPYTKGQVGMRMALRFSDTTVMQLELPKPTYTLELSLTKFKRVLYSEAQGIGKAWVFGSFCELKMQEPFTGKVFFAEALKKGVTVKEIEGWSSVYEWYPYKESLELMLDEFVRSISTEKRLQPAKNQLERCR